MTSLALPSTSGVGDLLREWRHRLSQLDLAGEAEVSTRHLSFAERLDMPLWARNQMLNAAGFAALYPERPFDAPELVTARRTVEAILAAHAPFPALAVDRHWTLLSSNAAVAPLLAGVAEALLAPPVNVLRLSLHPDGLAPRIDNLGEWRAHLLARLQQQVAHRGAPRRARGLFLPRERHPAARPCRLRRAAAPARRGPARAAVADQHDDGLRHAAGHHPSELALE